MANMYIQEYEDMALDGHGNATQVGAEPALTSQKVAFTTSTASSAFNVRTRFVRITVDAEAHIAFGAAPTATTSSMNIQADTPEYFGVTPGQKVAAVTA